LGSGAFQSVVGTSLATCEETMSKITETPNSREKKIIYLIQNHFTSFGVVGILFTIINRTKITQDQQVDKINTEY
jgi:hypothetical protein